MRISLPFFILGFPPTPASARKGEIPFAQVLGAEGAAPGAAPIPAGGVAARGRADPSAAPMDRILERDIAGEEMKGAPAPALTFTAFGAAAPMGVAAPGPVAAAPIDSAFEREVAPEGMKGASAPAFAFGAFGGAAAIPTGVAAPGPVAAAPIYFAFEREVAREGIEGASTPAFAFGAFGVFAPARHGAAARGAGALQPEAITAAAEVQTPNAMAARASGAVVAGAVDAVAAGDRASAPGLRTAAHVWAVATTHVAAASAPSAPTTPEAPPAEEAAASGGAPRPQVATPRRTRSASLVVVERDGRLSVVAAAPDLKSADHAQARLRLASAAAELGASLEDLHINGEAANPPAKGGLRHGHRAR